MRKQNNPQNIRITVAECDMAEKEGNTITTQPTVPLIRREFSMDFAPTSGAYHVRMV